LHDTSYNLASGYVSGLDFRRKQKSWRRYPTFFIDKKGDQKITTSTKGYFAVNLRFQTRQI
jgi:hypothetical protein